MNLASRWGIGLLVVVFATATLMAACSDDVESTTSIVPATTTTSGAGGSGGAATTTVGTGGMSGIVCDYDGRCNRGTDAEHCACPDCWYYGGECNASSSCADDGVCTNNEGCFCADCVDEPACADYCVSCRHYTLFFSSPAALCSDGNPSSASLWSDLEACACGGGLCTTECSSNLCANQPPSAACIDCMEDTCAPERDACLADVRAHVYCNPLEAKPCAKNNFVCDVYKLGTGLLIDEPPVVAGFECYSRTTNTALCEACDYAFGSQTYCPLGQTCVDAAGEVAGEGQCGKFCCDDGDCGGGSCIRGPFDAVSTGLGTCDMSPGGGGGGIGGAPGCDPAAGTPSLGSCVTVSLP